MAAEGELMGRKVMIVGGKRGGARPNCGGSQLGAGRPRGSKDKKPRKRRRDSAVMRAAREEGENSDLPPIVLFAKDPNGLAILQAIYKDPAMPTELRADAAKAALPYESRRLPIDKNITYTGEGLVGLLASMAAEDAADVDDEEDAPTRH